MPHQPHVLRRGITLATLALLAVACSRDVLDPASPRAAGTTPHRRVASPAPG